MTAEGVWQSRRAELIREEQSHLDELTERMAWLERQGFGHPLVHIIDREADSVGHYYRWQIESYFKLLKETGHQLESWEQETGLALFKRLLIASQSCLLVWRLLLEQRECPQRTKEFLVRLSGRQTKRSRPITASAVLDGLFKLFTLLETLNEYSVEELRAFADFAFPRRFKSAPEGRPMLV